MASRKSAATLDNEVSQDINLRSEVAALTALLAEARGERDFFKANSLRKESVIQMLQKKCDRLAGPATSDRRTAMDAAKAAAMAGQSTVSVKFND